MRPAVALAALLPALAAGQTGPSLEGFTGYLATPSAWVQPEGTAQLLFTNAQYGGAATTRTYVLGVGWLGHLEFAGRITDAWSAAGLRDLSANLKLRLPLDLVWPRLPVAVAVGTQDEGGTALHFQSRYAVVSARLWRLTASLGWGSGPDRMEGLFAGGSLEVSRWLEVLADWDAADASAGARLSVPLGTLPVRLGGIVKARLSRDPVRVEWGATLEIPLRRNATASGRTPVPEARRPSDAAVPPSADPVPDGSPREAAPVEPRPSEDPALRSLEDALVEIGFEDVRAGREGDLVVVEYENRVFNHAQADGFQVVRREIERAGLGQGPLAVVVKENGLRVAELLFPRAGSGAGPRWTGLPPRRCADWASPTPRSRSALHPQLVLAPGLRTFLATEVGVLDFVLSLRPDLIVPLWAGATAFVRADVPLVWSDDFVDGRVLRAYRDDPRVEHALLHQALPLAPGLLAMVGGGLFRGEAGGVAEALWTPGDGALGLGIQGSWTATDEGTRRQALTGSLRCRLDRLAAMATVRAGRFFGGDRGATVEVSRWFGDTQVGLFYIRTDASLVGAFFTIPLTFRRDMRPRWVQVRGRRFGHDAATVVGEETNPIRVGLAIPPLSPWNLESSYLDEGRLSPGPMGFAVPSR